MSSAFLDKFSPEIRDMIYGFVFGSSERMKPLNNPEWYWCDSCGEEHKAANFTSGDGPIHTSILAACKMVNAEAVEVLYGKKIVRCNVNDLRNNLLNNLIFVTFVRHIEVSDDLYHCMDTISSAYLYSALEKLKYLPRLRSTFLLSDSLFRAPGITPDIFTSVMEFAHRAGLGRIVCTDIGRYQLHGDLSHVQVLNSAFSELWPAVRATPANYCGFDDAMAILNSLHVSVFVHNVPAWVSQTSLRCWVNIQQQYLQMQRSGKWQDFEEKLSAGTLQDDTDEEEMYHFFWSVATQLIRSPISNYPLLQTSVNALSKLKPGDGSAVLDQASEFISLNITGFLEGKFHLTARPFWNLRATVWGEGRDRKTKLEYMLEQQSSAMSGDISNEFILDPSRAAHHTRNNLITRFTAMRWLDDDRLFRWPDGVSDAAEVRQLTYLHMALSPFEILSPDVDDDYSAQRNEWSHRILKHWILASTKLTPIQFETSLPSASLQDLRTIVTTVLEVLELYGPDSDTYVASLTNDILSPPEWFDELVYSPLGWKYGPLFKEAADRYLSRETVPKTLASQWVKERAMWK